MNMKIQSISPIIYNNYKIQQKKENNTNSTPIKRSNDISFSSYFFFNKEGISREEVDKAIKDTHPLLAYKLAYDNPKKYNQLCNGLKYRFSYDKAKTEAFVKFLKNKYFNNRITYSHNSIRDKDSVDYLIQTLNNGNSVKKEHFEKVLELTGKMLDKGYELDDANYVLGKCLPLMNKKGELPESISESIFANSHYSTCRYVKECFDMALDKNKTFSPILYHIGTFLVDDYSDVETIKNICKTKDGYFDEKNITKCLKLSMLECSIYGINDILSNFTSDKQFDNFIERTKKIYSNIKKHDEDYKNNAREDYNYEIFDSNNIDLQDSVVELLGENKFIKYTTQFIINGESLEPYYKEYTEALSRPEPLKELLNPTETQKYKQIQEEIKTLKQEYKKGNHSNDLINKIKTKTKEASALTNLPPIDAMTSVYITTIYNRLAESQQKQDYFINMLKAEKEIDKDKLAEIIKKEELIIEGDKNLLKKINYEEFSSENMLSLLIANQGFYDNLEDLLNIITKAPAENIGTTLNKLPQNRKTKEIFKKYNLNYEAWNKVNPQRNIHFNLELNTDDRKNNIIKNFKTLIVEMLDSENIPFEHINELKKFLIQQQVINPQKNLQIDIKFNEINFEKLKTITPILKDYLNTSEFWSGNSKYYDNQVNEAREHYVFHLYNDVFNNLKSIDNIKGTKRANITIKKVDMNNLASSLFLGNDASCCTAIGSFNDWSAPNYIKNKMFSAIEVLDGEKPIGNTMCYLAEVNGQPSLILDNIELKSAYQYNEKIKKGILEYAKSICKDLSKPNLHIYVGPERHKVNFDEYEKNIYSVKFIGTTNNEPVYIDCICGEMNPENKQLHRTELIKIR